MNCVGQSSNWRADGGWGDGRGGWRAEIAAGGRAGDEAETGTAMGSVCVRFWWWRRELPASALRAWEWRRGGGGEEEIGRAC